MAASTKSSREDILFAFGVAVLLFICFEIRHTLLLVYVSIVFAIVFMPLVHWVQRLQFGKWHPSRGIAVLGLIATVLIALAAFGFLLIPSIANDVQNLGSELPQQISHIRMLLQQLPFGARLASAIDPSRIESTIGTAVKTALNSLLGVTTTVTKLILLVLLTAYFIIDAERSFRWSMSLVERERRARLAVTLARATARMQKWLAGQGVLMLILGGSSLIVFWLLEIRYFYALALFAALANFVPILGPIATVILAGMVAAMDSWMKLLGVLIFYVVYQQVENSYLTPRIMKNTVELPAVAIVLALAIGGSLAGIAGAIVAVPTAALVATVIDEYLQEKTPGAPTDSSQSA